MRRQLSLAFYLNSAAMGLFFMAVFITAHRWHVALQWLGAAALACGIVFLVLRK